MGKQPGKAPYRKEFNNYNPHNKLNLNKFHQISHQAHPKVGHQLHKQKRDLQRMIQYRSKQGLEVEEEKIKQLEEVERQLEGRQKEHSKQQRKEHYLAQNYRQIMNIEKRKVAKKIRQLKQAGSQAKEELAEWIRKLNYIKYFPPNLKYVALFPNTPLSDKALQFQKGIMDDIEAKRGKELERMNAFESQQKPKQKKVKKDDFFVDQEEEDAQIEEQQ